MVHEHKIPDSYRIKYVKYVIRFIAQRTIISAVISLFLYQNVRLTVPPLEIKFILVSCSGELTS